jgi:hypothetical protein
MLYLRSTYPKHVLASKEEDGGARSTFESLGVDVKTNAAKIIT